MSGTKGSSTSSHKAAARLNGAKGGRTTKGVEKELARIRRQVRILGGRQSRVNLEFWISVRDDSRFTIEARLTAAAQIEDRYGSPKQAVITALPSPEDMGKLFDLSGGSRFAPPMGWNGDAHTNGDETAA